MGIIPVIMVVALATGQTTGPAAPQPHSQPAASLIDRAADLAGQKLLDRVMAARLSNGLTLSALLAPVPQAELAFREAVLAAAERIALHSRSADGAMVRISITTERLEELLRGILAEHVPAVKPETIELAPPVTLLVVSAGPPGWGSPSDAPVAWRHCSARQIALAGAAAVADLQRRLLNSLQRLALGDDETLGQLGVRQPEFIEAVEAGISTLVPDSIELETSGVARATLQLSAGRIEDLLARSAARVQLRRRVNWNQIINSGLWDGLRVEGYGVAPPVFAMADADAESSKQRPVPAWVGRTLFAKASGQAPTDAGDEDVRRELATQAARVEAARRLWIEIENLRLPDGGQVRDRLLRDPAAAAAVDAAVVPATAPEYDAATGTAQVQLGIPLAVVWELFGG